MTHFLTDMSNRVEHQKLNQTTAELSFGWVFGVQLGLRQTQALIKTKTIRRRNVPPAKLLLSSKLLLRSHVAGGILPLLIVLVLISACVCRRPTWTPKTQPGGSSAATWLSFWCSTRLLMSVKKCLSYRGKTCKESLSSIVVPIDWSPFSYYRFVTNPIFQFYFCHFFKMPPLQQKWPYALYVFLR